MKRVLILIIILLVVQVESLDAQTSLDSTINKARNSIISLIEEENIIGLSISISYNDSLVWSEGFGHSDLNRKKAIDPSKTLFRIASISKPFTATILGRLYEEKILNLESSVYSYIPDFPRKEYDFTLSHLATHRSGIRHYNAFENENRKSLSIEEGLTKFKNSELKFKPGTEYLYSSYGYNLLGFALEKASNKSFEELMKTYITKPLGLNNTIPDYGIYDKIEVSGFFMSNGKGKVKEAKSVNYAMKLPSGGLLSTSEDLVIFGNSYAYNRLLTREIQSMMLTDNPLPSGKKTGYGFGWGLNFDKKGRKVISHTGGNTGSVCRLIVYPELNLTIAVVCNTFGIDWLKFTRTVNNIPKMIIAGEEIN